MRHLCLLLIGVLALPLPPAALAQDAPSKLNLIVVEGDGAINNIRQRTAREPIVQVEDENHRPVAGAAVVFSLPSSGPSGAFAGGAHSLTVTTDAQGRAIAHGLKPNNVQGQYQIHVNASSNGQTASTNISQSNAIIAGAAGAAGVGISAKLLIIIAVAGAAAAGGALYATGAIGGGNNNATTPAASLVTITPGTGTVGPPR
ncbi:MAG TPA: hypothetical protein VG456_00605 [Candidatus Sulfopaludibacter sp.]|jgi:hypothetical protein|nr:hypothetical protein [Candidatus Sulfopaludibacter sp.]